MKKKILAFTAIRSEYDLLSGLYILLSRDKDIDFKVIVSGAHLSEKSGYTVKDIEEDGLEILAKIIQPDKFKDLIVSVGSFSHIS